MKPLVIIVCMSALYIGTAYGRLSKDELRKALSQNPLFSAPRGSSDPFLQNVNIRLPISDPDVQVTNNNLPNLRPVVMEARTSSRVQPVQQQRRIAPVVARKPIREQEMLLGQIKPTKVAQSNPVRIPAKSQQSIVASRPSSNTANDRLLNNVRPAATTASAEQQGAASKSECSFHIPSFLLPDPHPSNIGSSLSCPSFLLPGPSINPELVNLMVEHWTGIKSKGKTQLKTVKSQITQVEFEQKCLIPALRAHVLGGPACKTRELKVYLEWLLYLRQRLFNI